MSRAFYRLHHVASLGKFEIREAVGQKLFVKAVPEAMKTCLLRKVLGIRELFGSSKQNFSNSRHAPVTAEIKSIEWGIWYNFHS